MFHQTIHLLPRNGGFKGGATFQPLLQNQQWSVHATCQCEGWPFALQEYLPKRKVLGVMSVWVYFSCYTRLESRWELVVSVEITTFLSTNADGSIAICHILNQWIATEFIKALKFWVNLHHFLSWTRTLQFQNQQWYKL